MIIKKEVAINLTKDEELAIIRMYAKNEPKTVEAILKGVSETGRTGDCPFPKYCKKYPCETMSCNADMLSVDGYAYRMS